MSVLAGRTIIGCIVFLDIVAFSKTPDARQMAMKNRLNEAIASAISDIAETEHIILDTGDGAAICFFGDPEDAMFVVNAIRKSVARAEGDAAQKLRIGINLGPIKVVTDVTGRPNVVGDGINVAQRIMSFAAGNEILVSRSYYEVVACLRQGNERLFTSLGVRTDKHVREHQVYAFVMQGSGAAVEPSVVAGPAKAPSGHPLALAEDEIKRVMSRLAKLIGPLARIIVERAAKSAKDPEEFYRTVAAPIHDEADRAAFLAAAGLKRDKAAEKATPPEEVSPDSSINDADLRHAETRLAQYIGPLAKILTRKHAAEAADLDDLYRRLADNIKRESDRIAFLSKAGAPN